MKRLKFLASSGLASSALYAGDWEYFQGPNGNGISDERGLRSKSLKQIWNSNIKTGFSSISVSNGLVYSMGNENNTDFVYALDSKTGKKVWEYSYPCELTPNLYEGGPNATPTISDGKVYTLSKEGDAFCFEAKTGKVIWQKDCTDFGAKKPKWGFAGSPTIVGSLVLLSVGDSGAALNKDTGEKVWSSSGEDAGYAPVVPYSSKNAIMLCGESFKGVEISSGKVLWTEPFMASYKVNAATPIIVGKHVLISTGYGEGRSALYSLSGSKPKKLWENTEIKSHFSNPIYLNGYFYAVSGNTGKSCKFKCLSAKTGKLMWEKRCKFGSLRATKDKLYFLDEKGYLYVSAVNPKSYKEITKKQILQNRCWTPPTISNGLLYARDAIGDIVALDLKS